MRSWQIFKIWGIPIKIHSNWIVLLLLLSWSISNQVNFSSSDTFNEAESLLIGSITSLCFLLSIIFHQILHTFVCLKEGIKIKSITFYFLGAVLKTEKECQNPITNIKISLVRPVLCIFTSIILFLLSYSSGSKDLILINIISRVGVLNLFLGILNFVPFGSLDGGILFKSIIWYLSGNKVKGQKILNKLNLFLSVVIFFVGILLILSFNFYYGFLISLLGFLCINSSKSESQFFKIEKILKENNISNLKLKPLRKIDFDLTVKNFNKFITTNKDNKEKYFFVTKNGRWEGYLTIDEFKNLSMKRWESTLVGQYKKPISDFPSCKENTPLWRIIEKIEKTSEGILLVTNPLGIPKGIIDRDKIGYYVLQKLGLNISFELINKIKSKNNYPLGIELPKIIELMKNKGDID